MKQKARFTDGYEKLIRDRAKSRKDRVENLCDDDLPFTIKGGRRERRWE